MNRSKGGNRFFGAPDDATRVAAKLHHLTRAWGDADDVALYLDKCQVDTPPAVVEASWRVVRARRRRLGKVVDFGAGDGRFALGGEFDSYVGYEVDPSRLGVSDLPCNATLLARCAFSEPVEDADLCLGNPPYVRNQDLPRGWREHVARSLYRRSGVRVCGLANAWQYFFLLSLLSTKATGLVVLVIPYEWVSRPSAAAIRQYIRGQGWRVGVYRLLDDAFPRVLTTSSITVVDKARRDGLWEYYSQVPAGGFKKLPSATSAKAGPLPYTGRARARDGRPFAKRGLSPGTQKVLALSEGERARYGLRAWRDVLPCVTTVRHLPPSVHVLDEGVFDRYYRDLGLRCWLINSGRRLSTALQDYLDSVPPEAYRTSTCLSRKDWWRFAMPSVPDILVSSGFVTDHTKVLVNSFGAHAVGGIYGVYRVAKRKRRALAGSLRRVRLSKRVVSHSNGLRKIEVHQLNTLIETLTRPGPPR